MTDKDKDIRWIQRFSNFRKALGQLSKFLQKGSLSDLEEQGLIQAFEYTFELAWNVLKDYYNHQGFMDIQGSRDAFKLAFNRGLIHDGEQWMRMVDDRIQSVHTYDETRAKRISAAISEHYYSMFRDLESAINAMLEDQNA